MGKIERDIGPDADVALLAESADEAAAGAKPGDQDLGAGAGPRETPTREMIANLLRALIAKATGRFPSLVAVWTAGDVENFSGALAPLLDKYGLTPAWLKAWEAEIAALLICGPLIFGTVLAVRADLEAERARAAKAAGEGATARAAAAAAGEGEALRNPPPVDGTVKPKSTGE